MENTPHSLNESVGALAPSAASDFYIVKTSATIGASLQQLQTLKYKDNM